MIKPLALTAAALAASFAAVPAQAMDILARVISSTPVVQQVAVPRQVCTNQAVVTEAPKSGAGALLGAVVGGALGNGIGNGSGRTVATMLGAVGGAVLGNNLEGSNNQVQNMQQCGTQTTYENRTSYYNVVYEYQGAQYTTQMANDPGGYVRLQVSAVGALPAAPAVYPAQPQYQADPQAQYQQPVQTFQPAPVVQSQTYYQTEVMPQPGYVVQADPYPVYAPQGYYAPSYAAPAVGLTLNLGYSRGYGGGHRGHWR